MANLPGGGGIVASASAGGWGHYFITSRSVSAFSTRVRSFSNSASDCVDPIFTSGNSVTVTWENGFGTANPSQELNRQYAVYSISNGMRGTWHLCDRRTAPGPRVYLGPLGPSGVIQRSNPFSKLRTRSRRAAAPRRELEPRTAPIPKQRTNSERYAPSRLALVKTSRPFRFG